MVKKTDINIKANELVQLIQEYSESQKKYWQQIPYLALQADGRSGYSDQYGRAYRTGFWAINASNMGGFHQIYVDLATGKLVDAYSASSYYFIGGRDISKNVEIKPASEKYILMIAPKIDELNANKIVTSLKKEGKQKYFRSYDPKEQEAWREKLIAELRLSEIFTRQEYTTLKKIRNGKTLI